MPFLPGLWSLVYGLNRPRSCTRWKRQSRQERGRPRPHQPDNRSCTCFNQTNPTPEHSPVGCGEESPRSHTRWNRQRPQERGRPRPHQPDNRSCTCFNQTNPTPEHSPVGCGEESPRSQRALGKATASGARPSSAASTRQPIVHLLQS